MTNPYDSKLPFKGWYYIYPLLFGLAYAQKPIFTSNQNTKFITGLSLAEYGDIAADWMAHITDPFPVFSHLLKWTYQFFGLYVGVHLSFLMLTGIYALFCVWLAHTRLKNENNRAEKLWIFSFLWLLIHTEGLRQFWGHFFPEGLAYQYMLGEYYQPCCFGVFLIGGITAYISKRFIFSVICFIIAPLFHPTYIIAAFCVPFSLILLPANKPLGITWRNRGVFFFLVFIFVIPYAIWNANLLTSGDPETVDKAHRILAEHRIPHHSLPSHWDFRLTLQFFIAGFLAVWIERKHLLGQILFVLLAVALTSTVFAAFIFNPTLAALAPWRVSVLAAPLSWVILIAKSAKWISVKLGRCGDPSVQKFKQAALFLVVVACLVGSVETGLNYMDKTKRPDYLIASFLSTYHKSGNLYLVPPDLKNIRLEAGVPVFVTTKSHPTKDNEFLIWYERLKIANAVFNTDNILSTSKLKDLLEKNSLTHIVWPASGSQFPYKNLGHKVYADQNYSLWDMR